MSFEKQKTFERDITIQDSLGLQTYEFFDGGSERKERVQRFVLGEDLEINLDYPCLDTVVLNRHVANLGNRQQIGVGDGSATPEYRLAEAYFLLSLERLPNFLKNHSEKSGQDEINRIAQMNKELYGEIDPLLFNAMLGKIWKLLEKAEQGPVAEVVRELREGFVFKTATTGEELAIAGLPVLEAGDYDTLPTLSSEAYQWLEGEVKDYKDAVIQVSEQLYPDAQEFTPDAIAEIFKKVIEKLDLPVLVRLNPDATTLSWSSSENAVIIGGNRKNIKTAEDVAGLFVHEVVVHGLRHNNGEQLHDDSLANGLFTDADQGDDPDYLVFEEGMASVLQKVAQGKNETWPLASMANYINISLASMGYTSREVYEVMRRVRVAVQAKGETIEGGVLDKAQNNAVASIIRTFRGMPSQFGLHASDESALHYGKDRVYAAGKVKAIRLFNEMVQLPANERSLEFKKLFLGKNDPTNKHQAQYLERAIKGVE